VDAVTGIIPHSVVNCVKDYGQATLANASRRLHFTKVVGISISWTPKAKQSSNAQKSKECPKTICTVARDVETDHLKLMSGILCTNEWHTVQGSLGIHSCDTGLDSWADMMMVKEEHVHYGYGYLAS